MLELAFPLAQVSLPFVPPLLQLPRFQGVGLELHLVSLSVVFGLGEVLLESFVQGRLEAGIARYVNIGFSWAVVILTHRASLKAFDWSRQAF